MFQRSLRSTAEERVGCRCGNLRVLNSYWIKRDGIYKYYEVILVDPNHKAVSTLSGSADALLTHYLQVRRDAIIKWITKPVHKHRESRSLTSIEKQVSDLTQYTVTVNSMLTPSKELWFPANARAQGAYPYMTLHCPEIWGSSIYCEGWKYASHPRDGRTPGFEAYHPFIEVPSAARQLRPIHWTLLCQCPVPHTSFASAVNWSVRCARLVNLGTGASCSG